MNRLEDLGFPCPSDGSSAATGDVAEIPPTVLFVDDEPEVLAGLRLSLRRLRDRYHLRFAQSADEAIGVLESEPVDLVVTDMRMPGRSGADLLDELRFRFPDVIRYVLSGQAEDRLVRRSVAVTHRWLGKPCEPEVLVEAMTEAVGHRSSLGDPVLRRAVGAVDALPTHPVIHARLIDALAIDDAGPEPVAALVAVDPAMLAKLLQWANSAYGTRRRRSSTPGERSTGSGRRPSNGWPQPTTSSARSTPPRSSPGSGSTCSTATAGRWPPSPRPWSTRSWSRSPPPVACSATSGC